MNTCCDCIRYQIGLVSTDLQSWALAASITFPFEVSHARNGDPDISVCTKGANVNTKVLVMVTLLVIVNRFRMIHSVDCP